MYSNLVKAPDTLGQIVMTGDAAIVQSSGDLENNEEVAQTVFRMIHCASRDDILPKECSGSGDGIKRMCELLHYRDLKPAAHSYNQEKVRTSERWRTVNAVNQFYHTPCLELKMEGRDDVV
ncbi:uncharacterized protein LOC111259744 isoform X1 [Varroa jacobsoni]|uniref:uncharacterized protein LOC111259744 isoform X1 n=1 Tax=Varroa jacobsoni TaxID=62625 RepID=UPI000BF669CA|nr:uncharacterized protein LOC111259744 isoform X1 [Varroa jacobsoni]